MTHIRRTSLLEASWLRPLKGQPFGSTSLNITCLRLRGELDAAAVESALHGLAARHDVLRTFYSSEHEARVRDAAVSSRLIDARDAPMDWTVNEMWAYLKPRMTLATPPLWRSITLRLSSRESIIGFAFDMLIADAPSLQILIESFCELYNLFVSQASHAPDGPGRLPLGQVWPSYEAFADRQREELADPSDGKRRFWREYVAEFGPYPAMLRLGNSNPATSPGSVETVFEADIPHREDAALAALGARHGLTRFEIAAAALLRSAADHTGEQAPGLITDVHGRCAAEDHRTVGLFLHGAPVHLRRACDDRNGLLQHAAQIRDAMRDSAIHDMPIRACEAASADGLLRTGPTASLVLNVSDETSWTPPPLSGLKAEVFNLPGRRVGTRRVPSPNLLIDWRRTSTGVRVAAICDPARFPPAAVAELVSGAIRQVGRTAAS